MLDIRFPASSALRVVQSIAAGLMILSALTIGPANAADDGKPQAQSAPAATAAAPQRPATPATEAGSQAKAPTTAEPARTMPIVTPPFGGDDCPMMDRRPEKPAV